MINTTKNLQFVKNAMVIVISVQGLVIKIAKIVLQINISLKRLQELA